jgi:hypothetical protein
MISFCFYLTAWYKVCPYALPEDWRPSPLLHIPQYTLYDCTSSPIASHYYCSSHCHSPLALRIDWLHQSPKLLKSTGQPTCSICGRHSRLNSDEWFSYSYLLRAYGRPGYWPSYWERNTILDRTSITNYTARPTSSLSWSSGATRTVLPLVRLPAIRSPRPIA